MKVTIVVRTFKRPEFLKQALSSIQLQTYDNWEVILFDDSGSNENLKIYNTFKTNNPTKRIVYITSATPYDMFKDSWSISPKLSKGELIVRLDDDDLLAENSIEYIVNTYIANPSLDFSYGSATFFENDELRSKITTQTPIEAPKTVDIWEGYLHQHPYNLPWRFKHNHYSEPQYHSSIIHCSKANHMCVYHTYVMRVSSLLKVIDKLEVTSNFVDDLEAMGIMDYLGLSHTSIKKTLTYARIHSDGRVTDKEGNGEDTLWNNILRIRDDVEHYRTDGFQSNIYPNSIEGDINDTVDDSHRQKFSEYLSKVKNTSKTLG